MSTRSLTHIHEDGKILLTFYRHMDGYPEGHGKELCEFLKDMTVVNGIGMNRSKIANGIGCLAAQIIKHFKDDVGNVYIYPAGSSDCGEEYVYDVSQKNGNIVVTCRPVDIHGKPGKYFFTGRPADCLARLE